MAESFYTPGRLPQYGKARWERYEGLRVSGFSKYEARALSKIRMGDALDVVVEMSRTRQRLLSKAIKEGWSRYQYYIKVRAFYQRNNLTSVLKPDGTRVAKRAGRADVFVWFHKQERKMARQRGWRRDATFAVSRRPKKRQTPVKVSGKAISRRRGSEQPSVRWLISWVLTYPVVAQYRQHSAGSGCLAPVG